MRDQAALLYAKYEAEQYSRTTKGFALILIYDVFSTQLLL